MKRIRYRGTSRIAVPAILALMFVLYWIYVQWIAPLPFYYQPDPQMAYLLDSLSPFKGWGYRNAYHPGVTVCLIGTALYLLSYPFTTGSVDSLILYHLKDPGVFLAMGRSVLVILYVGTVLLIARFSTRNAAWWESLGGSAIAVVFFLLHGKAIRTSQVWTQDAFFFPFGTLFLLFVFLIMRDSSGPIRRRRLALMGVGSGALLATHLLYATYVFGIGIAVAIHAALLRSSVRTTGKNLFLFAASVMASFVVLMLPVASSLSPSMQRWWRLISTRGRYGGHEPIAPVEQLGENLAIVSVIPELFIGSGVIVLMVAVGLLRKWKVRSLEPGTTAIALGLLVQLVTAYVVLLVIKSETNVRYFLVVASMLPILLAVGLALLAGWGRVSAGLHLVVASVVIPMFVANMCGAFQVQSRLAHGFELLEAERDRMMTAYARHIGRTPESLRIV